MAMPRTHSECANARNIIWCVNCVAALVGIVLFVYAVQEGFCMLCTYFSHAMFIVLWSAQSESMAMPRTHSSRAKFQNIIGRMICMCIYIYICIYMYIHMIIPVFAYMYLHILGPAIFKLVVILGIAIDFHVVSGR